MPHFGPISLRDLIRYLHRLGFDGPEPGTRHAVMVRGTLKLRIPNPHRAEVSRDLLAEILRQANISREEWEAL